MAEPWLVNLQVVQITTEVIRIGVKTRLSYDKHFTMHKTWNQRTQFGYGDKSLLYDLVNLRLLMMKQKENTHGYFKSRKGSVTISKR